MRSQMSALVLGSLVATGVATANTGAGATAPSSSEIKIGAEFDLGWVYTKNATARSSDSTTGLHGGDKVSGFSLANENGDVDVNLAALTFSGVSKNVNWLIEVNGANESGNNTSYINQAYLKHEVNENLSVMAGRFYTFFGFEGMKARGNWNYTRNFAFNSGPFWHDGLSASYDLKNGLVASVFFLGNRTDNDDNSGSSQGLGAQVVYSMDKLVLDLDVIKDNPHTTTTAYDGMMKYNLSATYDATEQLSVALSYFMGSGDVKSGTTTLEQKFSSLTAYAKFKATEQFYAALRYEMFTEEVDNGGSLYFAGNSAYNFNTTSVGNENDLNSLTLTGAYDLLNGSEVRLEYRMDSSDKNVYNDDGTADDKMNAIAVAWLFNY